MSEVWKPHATVAAIVERDGRFLMIEEIVNGKTVYNQPAGHLDPGESLVAAVIRETQEESAWRFIPEYISGVYRWEQTSKNRSFLRFTFVGGCDQHDDNQTLDKGILRALWLSREELIAEPDKLRTPMVLRCIDDYLAGKKYPLSLLTDII